MTLDMIIDQYTEFLTFKNKEITAEQIAVLTKLWEEIGGQFANNTRENEQLNLVVKGLTLQNIGPYASLTVDFDEKGLVAVDGQVGAGKSTIFESMFFALTGRTNKFGSTNMKHLKSKVHKGEALIQLTFDLNGVEYVIQKKSSSVNTASFQGGGININGVEEVKAKVEEILPLSQTQLAYCIYLAQGEWDTMLSATPTNLRKMVVDKILNLGLYSSIYTAMGTILDKAVADLNHIKGQNEDRDAVRNEDMLKLNAIPCVQNGLFQPRELSDGTVVPRIADAFKTLTNDVQEQMTQHLLMEQRLKEMLSTLQESAVQPEEASLSMKDLIAVQDMVTGLQGVLNSLSLLSFNKPVGTLSSLDMQELHHFIAMIENGQMTPEIFSSMILEHQTLVAQKTSAVQAKNEIEEAIASKQAEAEMVFAKYEQMNNKHLSNVEQLNKIQQHVQQQQDDIIDVESTLTQKSVEIEQSNASLLQILTDLSAIYESLLTQSIGFIQQYVQEHNLDECPVCMGELGTMSQSDGTNGFYAMDYLKQRDLLNEQKGMLQTTIERLTLEVQNGQANVVGLNAEVQSLKDDTAVLEEVVTIEKSSVEQARHRAESARQGLKELHTNLDAHQAIIDGVDSQISTMSTWVKRNHQTVMSLIQQTLDVYGEWDHLKTGNAFLASYNFDPTTIPQIQRLIHTEQALHAANQHSPEEAILQKQSELAVSVQAKLDYWSQFENDHPEWMGRVNVNTLSLADWKSVCTAVQLQKSLQAHAVQIQIIEEKLETQNQTVAMLKALQADFHNGSRGIQHYLADALLVELSELAQATLESFFGPECKLTYKNGFKLTHKKMTLPVDALSGGERFYVAMALAFAMKQFIQVKRKIQIDTLFIDEGFHMLKDVDISTMIHVLESKSGDAGIWLITHNAALVNEIKTVYTASNAGLILSSPTVSIA